MDEAFFDRLRHTLYFFEVLAAVTGVLSRKKIKNSFWKYFAIYLLIIAAGEIFAEVHYYLTRNANFNGYFYFLFLIPFQFAFFFWMFYRYFEERTHKTLVLVLTTVYFASLLLDILFINSYELWFKCASYTVGNILLLILVLLFFMHLSKDDRILEYKCNCMFWVCCGLLVFYLGSLPFYGLWNMLSASYPEIFNVYSVITYVLDCIMYCFFALAFIWKKPN